MSTVISAKNKIGRPSIDSEAVNVRLDRRLLERLDEWIVRQHGTAIKRPAAVREILKQVLGQ